MFEMVFGGAARTSNPLPLQRPSARTPLYLRIFFLVRVPNPLPGLYLDPVIFQYFFSCLGLQPQIPPGLCPDSVMFENFLAMRLRSQTPTGALHGTCCVCDFILVGTPPRTRNI